MCAGVFMYVHVQVCSCACVCRCFGVCVSVCLSVCLGEHPIGLLLDAHAGAFIPLPSTVCLWPPE